MAASSPAGPPDRDRALIKHWQGMVHRADRNNVFCQCRHCQYEWVASARTASCPQCASPDVERIACWQFPDG